MPPREELVPFDVFVRQVDPWLAYASTQTEWDVFAVQNAPWTSRAMTREEWEVNVRSRVNFTVEL